MTSEQVTNHTVNPKKTIREELPIPALLMLQGKLMSQMVAYMWRWIDVSPGNFFEGDIEDVKEEVEKELAEEVKKVRELVGEDVRKLVSKEFGRGEGDLENEEENNKNALKAVIEKKMKEVIDEIIEEIARTIKEHEKIHEKVKTAKALKFIFERREKEIPWSIDRKKKLEEIHERIRRKVDKIYGEIYEKVYENTAEGETLKDIVKRRLESEASEKLDKQLGSRDRSSCTLEILLTVDAAEELVHPYEISEQDSDRQKKIERKKAAIILKNVFTEERIKTQENYLSPIFNSDAVYIPQGPEQQASDSPLPVYEFFIDPDSFIGRLEDPDLEYRLKFKYLIAVPPRPELSEATVTREKLVEWYKDKAKETFRPKHAYIPVSTT